MLWFQIITPCILVLNISSSLAKYILTFLALVVSFTEIQQVWESWCEDWEINLLDQQIFMQVIHPLEVGRCVHVSFLCVQHQPIKRLNTVFSNKKKTRGPTHLSCLCSPPHQIFPSTITLLHYAKIWLLQSEDKAAYTQRSQAQDKGIKRNNDEKIDSTRHKLQTINAILANPVYLHQETTVLQETKSHTRILLSFYSCQHIFHNFSNPTHG